MDFQGKRRVYVFDEHQASASNLPLDYEGHWKFFFSDSQSIAELKKDLISNKMVASTQFTLSFDVNGGIVNETVYVSAYCNNGKLPDVDIRIRVDPKPSIDDSWVSQAYQYPNKFHDFMFGKYILAILLRSCFNVVYYFVGTSNEQSKKSK